MKTVKKFPSIACCGLDCGLCPNYYTKGPSKCPGCCGPDFFNRHPSCSIVTCCIKNKNYETCADCDAFPCSKLKNWDIYDSFICHRVSILNLNTIKKSGIENFYIQQKNRIKLLEEMLENFNEGRSKSFFCIATALLPIDILEESLKNAIQKIEQDKIKETDIKSRSNILKSFLNEYAIKRDIELKLRKK